MIGQYVRVVNESHRKKLYFHYSLVLGVLLTSFYDYIITYSSDCCCLPDNHLQEAVSSFRQLQLLFYKEKGMKMIGQMTIYRKIEVIQSYLRIWGRYTAIESGPSELKKWGFYRCQQMSMLN